MLYYDMFHNKIMKITLSCLQNDVADYSALRNEV